jgi:hypothetical protein
LAEDAENHTNSAMGGRAVGEEGGRGGFDKHRSPCASLQYTQ